jgi:amidohydrolase
MTARELFLHLHAHPELSGAEYATTALLTQQLQAAGIRVMDSGLPTGLIASLGDATAGPTVVLRADIDALPIQEHTGLDYASETDGVMHACGHDLHAAALYGAALELAEQARHARLPGRVLFVFQPAEETSHGAEAVIATGLLDGAAAIIGAHGNPDLRPGQFSMEPGPVMAGVDWFRVRLDGRGGHASEPQLCDDIVLAAAGMVTELQQVVARSVAPLSACVLSVTHMEFGDAWNVLPSTGYFEGTMRNYDDAVALGMRARLTSIVTGIAAAHGIRAAIEWVPGDTPWPATANDAALVARLTPALEQVLEHHPIPPATGGEDFAMYARVAPGAFAMLGANGSPDAPRWHNECYTVLPEALPGAVTFYRTCVQALLA